MSSDGLNQQRIDITVTAALRPDVIRDTARSVADHFLTYLPDSYSARAIVNIDPVGEEGVTQDEVEEIYRTVFPDLVVFKPERPSFPLAVRRVWREVQTPVAFHAEDSKLLTRAVPVEKILRAFELRPKLAAVSLPPLKQPTKSPVPPRWDDEIGFYVVPFFRKAVTFQPSFFRRDYLAAMVPFLREGVSPEKTVKAVEKWLGTEDAGRVRAAASDFGFGFISLEDESSPQFFENIGRKWRLERRLVKDDGGITTSWVQESTRLPTRRIRTLSRQVRERRLPRLLKRWFGRSI
jgi:hypothetical protein